MSDEVDNLTLRVLQKVQTDVADGFRRVDDQLADVRTDMGQLRAETKAGLADVVGVTRKTLSEVVALAERVEHVETGLRVAERLAALERQMAELHRRLGS